MRVRIGELADRLDINPRTLRYYERIGLLPEPQRTAASYREYGEDAAELVTFIKTAQRIGMHLDEIGEILALRQRGERPCRYVRDVLHHQVRAIDTRIAELQHLRTVLVALDESADQLAPSSTGCRIIEHVRHMEAAGEPSAN